MRIVSDDGLLLDELHEKLENSSLKTKKVPLEDKKVKGSWFELLTNADFLETVRVVAEYLYKGFEIYIGYRIVINGKVEEVEEPIDTEIIKSKKEEDQKLLEDLSHREDAKIIIKRK